jgi:Tol biopolymer transport system component
VSVSTAPRPTGPGGLSGTIAVPIFDDYQKTYDIYLFDIAGRQFSRTIAEASQPALSRDGRSLAYRRWKTDDRGIVVTDLTDGASLRVTNFLEDVLPSWSVDGTKLVFSSYRHPDHGKRKSRLFWLWADANRDWGFERGPDAVYGEDPFWMNDGRIVFRRFLPNGGLYVMDRDGWADSLVLSDESALAPAVSPDDRTILFMSQRDGNWELYSVSLDGSSLTRLTSNSAIDGLPTWSPDGRMIAWVSDRSGEWALWVMDAGGGNKRMLATLPGSIDGRVKLEPEYLNHGWLEEQISWGP